MRILDDRYLAEDVTQEVFVRLFRTPPGEEVHSPRAWVFAVTHNTALNMLKSRRVRAAEPLSEETSPAEADGCDTRLDIEAAMKRLEPTDREIVTLHAVADAGFREIAEAVGLPQGTVYFRYRRAISKLRDLLA